MLPPLRLVTIHPALTHVTIGGVVIAAIAYLIAARRRSQPWSFAADATLTIAAVSAIATAAFGAIASAALPWPGGLEAWRAVHVLLGVATTLGLISLAAWRRRARAARPIASSGDALAALLVLALAAATGFVGGEGLVFHAGMAVRAAGDGALAPPATTRTSARDFLDAMREVRASWGAIDGELAWMLVHHPRPDGYARIAAQADHIASLTGTMAREKDMADGSAALERDARELADAARAGKLGRLARAAGATSATCAACHEEERWNQ